MTDMEYTLDERVVSKPPADPDAALAEALRVWWYADRSLVGLDGADLDEVLQGDAEIISAALDAAGFAVVPKETAKRDLEECLRQNGYAIDLVQRNERLQEALDEWERMARQEAKEWNDKHI